MLAINPWSFALRTTAPPLNRTWALRPAGRGSLAPPEASKELLTGVCANAAAPQAPGSTLGSKDRPVLGDVDENKSTNRGSMFFCPLLACFKDHSER